MYHGTNVRNIQSWESVFTLKIVFQVPQTLHDVRNNERKRIDCVIIKLCTIFIYNDNNIVRLMYTYIISIYYSFHNFWILFAYFLHIFSLYVYFYYYYSNYILWTVFVTFRFIVVHCCMHSAVNNYRFKEFFCKISWMKMYIKNYYFLQFLIYIKFFFPIPFIYKKYLVVEHKIIQLNCE